LKSAVFDKNPLAMITGRTQQPVYHFLKGQILTFKNLEDYGHHKAVCYGLSLGGFTH
jgi:hypothetical protein